MAKLFVNDVPDFSSAHGIIATVYCLWFSKLIARFYQKSDYPSIDVYIVTKR